MTPITFALAPTDAPGIVLKVLAILGGFLLGGILVGFLARLMVRLVTTRAMPLWSLRLMRLLGGVAGGWLVAMFVFGGGGSGVGGTGGFGFGSGRGNGEERTSKKPEDEIKVPKKDKDEGAKDGNLIRVAVLGPTPLQNLWNKRKPENKSEKDGPESDRCYMIEGEKPFVTHDIEEIKKEIRDRREKLPELKVVLVIYEDSPDEGNDLVQRLYKWLVDEALFKSRDLPPEKAPY